MQSILRRIFITLCLHSQFLPCVYLKLLLFTNQTTSLLPVCFCQQWWAESLIIILIFVYVQLQSNRWSSV